MKTTNRRILKADIMLVAVLLLAGCVLALLPAKEGCRAEILRAGKTVGVYPLNADRDIEVRDESGKLLNTVRIENGKAFVCGASCPGKDCVAHPPIYREGQCIVCLPNAVTVVIRGGGEIDGVTG